MSDLQFKVSLAALQMATFTPIFMAPTTQTKPSSGLPLAAASLPNEAPMLAMHVATTNEDVSCAHLRSRLKALTATVPQEARCKRQQLASLQNRIAALFRHSKHIAIHFVGSLHGQEAFFMCALQRFHTQWISLALW
jgi:hypothetical protein